MTALPRQALSISATVCTVDHHRSALFKGLKCASACLGTCDDVPAEPFHRSGPEEGAAVEIRLVDLSITTDNPVLMGRRARPPEYQLGQEAKNPA